MNLKYLSFTDKGNLLAKKLAETLGGESERCGEYHSLSEWTKENFYKAEGLVFVGAVGIAVRAIAPFLQNKGTDPAVVVVDEGGKFAIPVLSGHLGGANDLARKICRVCGAVPVITTATDVNDVFAVDEWAKRQGCVVENIHKIKEVSGQLLRGKEVTVRSDWTVKGERPPHVVFSKEEQADVCLSIRKQRNDGLHLIPRIAVLGIGCRKGTSMEKIEAAFRTLLQKTDIHEKAICLVASIDLKKEEQGLLEFCKAHDFPFCIYPAEELQQAEGDFTPSAFVERVTGVDNVCERSAVLGGGLLYQKKMVGDGVTMALSLRLYQPDWRWKDE